MPFTADCAALRLGPRWWEICRKLPEATFYRWKPEVRRVGGARELRQIEPSP